MNLAQVQNKEKNQKSQMNKKMVGNGILCPKLFWPTVRKKCSSILEKLLKFEVEDH